MPTRSSNLDLTTPDGVADCYLALPAGEPRGAVLFFIDAFGLRQRIREMADRIAGEGYAVLAPNVFYRHGPAPVLPMPDTADEESRTTFFAAVKPLMEELGPEAMARDGAAYLDALAERADGPAAISGYCMGGQLGWRVAAALPERVAALGCFHTGGLVADGEESPHRSADRLDSELYFGFAEDDRSMPPAQIAELEAALDAAGREYRAEVYAGAAHGYTMSDTEAWNEAACERHYRALFELLDSGLGRR